MTKLHSLCAPRASRADDRRRHLIDTARKLFAENGFHSTGMAQIAAASGIRVGQIYRDFSGKEDIVAAIVEADLAQFLEQEELTRAIESRDVPMIRGWIDRFVRFDKPEDKCRMVSEIDAEAARNVRIAAIQRDVDVKLKGMLTAAFEALSPDMDCTDRCHGVAALVLALGKGLMHRRLVDPEGDAALVGRAQAVIDRELADLLPAIA